MKKIVFVFLALCISVIAETTLKIEKIIDNGYGAVASGGGVVAGQSGFVMSWLTGSKRALVAKAIVVNVNQTESKIRFEVLEDIAQDSLPKYVALPKVGDEIVFGLFDSRTAVIAKNQGDYLKAIQQISGQTLHPDLVAFGLIKDRKGEPKAQNFKKFCGDYSIANIYFAIGSGLFKVDCGSMNVLEIQSFTPSNDKSFESPFFHRLGKIETGYLGFGTEEVKDYEGYYKRLLGVR